MVLLMRNGIGKRVLREMRLQPSLNAKRALSKCTTGPDLMPNFCCTCKSFTLTSAHTYSLQIFCPTYTKILYICDIYI